MTDFNPLDRVKKMVLAIKNEVIVKVIDDYLGKGEI
jgi:hypothetical protein